MSEHSEPQSLDESGPEERQLKDAVEAAFGPGSFELIAEENRTPSSLDGDPIADGEDLETVIREIDVALGSHHAALQDGGISSRDVEKSDQRHLVFVLDDAWFAVSMSNVLEIQRLHSVTAIPRVPA